MISIFNRRELTICPDLHQCEAIRGALDRAGVVLSLVSVGHMFTSKDGALAQFNAVSNDN